MLNPIDTARARAGITTRDRALFTPTPAQAGDVEVLRLIKKRASSATSDEVYRGER